MKYFLIALFLMTTQAQAAKIQVIKEIKLGAHISLSGKIKHGDGEKLEALVLPIFSKYRFNTRLALFLNSRGGSLKGSFLLSRIVRKYGIVTVLTYGRKCASACSFVFMAGWDRFNRRPYRIKHPFSNLGVHQPRDTRTGTRSNRRVMKIIKDYYGWVQAGEGMYEIMAKTHHSTMRYIKNRELSRMGGYTIQRGRIRWPVVERREDNDWEKRPHVHLDNGHPLPVKPTYKNTVVIK